MTDGTRVIIHIAPHPIMLILEGLLVAPGVRFCPGGFVSAKNNFLTMNRCLPVARDTEDNKSGSVALIKKS